jgi:flagellar biosynthesis protein FlhB
VASGSSERTERPTPRRLREARRRGQVALSRDLAAAAALAAAVAALAVDFPRVASLARGGVAAAAERAAAAPRFAESDAVAALDAALRSVTSASLPVAACALAAGAIAAALQTGCAAAPSALAPKAERLDPVAGLRRMLSLRTLAEFLKTWARLALVGAAAASAVAEHREALAGWLASGEVALGPALAVARSAALRSAALLLLAGAADVLLQRRLHERDLRMTKDEVRRDHKEDEGDPHLKGARKQAHREIATHRMVDAARTASFVAVNPTHLAAAVRYDEGSDDAPRVVARGAGDLARRIRRAAEESGVRVVRDRPLARALVRVPLDAEIPEALFVAVAEILAYVRETDDGLAQERGAAE